MPLAKETRIYKAFIASISLTIALCISGIFFGISVRTRNLIQDELVTNARSHFETIVMIRRWNAGYGGVYVEKKEGVESNPFLRNPDITTKDGKVYTLRNPAMMTREISKYARPEDHFSFRITSLNLINPENRPDAFETRALHLFDKGEKEAFETEVVNNRTHFRYMAPLYVENACLQCHAAQGYEVGDVRGGISVSFDIEDIQKKIRTNTYLTVILAIVTLSLLLALIWYFTRRLIRKIAESREQIEKVAITDGLTGIFNRRHLISRFEEEFQRTRRLEASLGCIMFDIDHFKVINDTYGHLAGDEVLMEIARQTEAIIRSYDILGRFGGEEFLIILPETGFQDVVAFAERIRNRIRDTVKVHTQKSEQVSVTVSLGITSIHDDDISLDDILRRVDKALYRAKNSGRDRVAWVETS